MPAVPAVRPGASRTLEVALRDLIRTRIVEHAPAGPGPDEVTLAVTRFALTSNNVSYARLGDQLGHWAAFPTAPGWGRVPAWGEMVVAAEADADPGLPTGSRIVGYLPMTDRLHLPLTRGTGNELVGTSPTRQHLAPVYRHYREVGSPADDLELATMHVEPLASVLVEDLQSSGVGHVVLTSAGSTTAQALAFLLDRAGIGSTGLTRNPSAIRQEGLTLAGYDDLSVVEIPAGSVLLDIAGDPVLCDRLLARFGDRLDRALRIGGTHPDRPRPPGSVAPGALAVERYGAGPRLAELDRDLGPQRVRERRARTRSALLAWASSTLEVRHVHGLDAAARAWAAIVAGRHRTREVVVVSL